MALYWNTAAIGDFEFTSDEPVEPGSDSGWNREPSVQMTRARGSASDTVLRLAMGSEKRSFSISMSPARWLTLKEKVGTVQIFTDWEGETRTAYVQVLQRQQGSRPFRVKVRIEMVEQ